MGAAQPDLADALRHAIGRLVGSLAQLGAARERGKAAARHRRQGWKLIPSLAPDETALTRLPWTGGFVAGQLWLASRVSGNRQLAAEAAAVTDFLAPRAAQPDTHDLGFLFWPSAVLGHLVTGDSKHRELALRAARSLTKRVLPAGVIQVIGALDDPDQRGRTIVDTLPNLTLLWWAEQEGIARAGEVARSHVAASLRACIREDGSTFHAVRFADDGRIVERGTVNGLAPGSTWARGQAWTICGLVSAYRATGDREILAAAERTAGFFCDRLPPGADPAVGLRCRTGRAHRLLGGGDRCLGAAGPGRGMAGPGTGAPPRARDTLPEPRERGRAAPSRLLPLHRGRGDRLRNRLG